MTLVYIFWASGDYQGYKDAIACAKARAGCPVYVISNQPDPGGVIHRRIEGFAKAKEMQKKLEATAGRWASLSLARWFILLELAEQTDIFPVFCADWDVLVFRNLKTAYAPFVDFDYTISKAPDSAESAAYGVNRLDPLRSFCEDVERSADENINDMMGWSRNGRAHNWKVGNLYEIQNKAVFDHSMHIGRNRFEFKGESLDVVFVDGYPFFRELETGTLIAANTLHCWWTAKTRTAEFRKLAGIKL